jgi:hypothetical protein
MTNDDASVRIDALKKEMEASTDADQQLMLSDQIAELRASLKQHDNVVQLFPEGELLPFPLDALPGEDTQTMVETVAKATENPVDPVAFVFFNMLSATYGAYVQIQRKEGYVKWCCDYAYLTGGSGVGKSPIFKLAERAVHEVESQLREDALERVKDAQALIARLEEDKRLLKKQYKGTDKDGFEAEIRDIEERIDEYRTVTMPEILLHDCSPEAMLLTQSENDDTASMVSAELPILSRLLGKATGKPPDIDALLSSYDGEFYRVKRITRAKNWIEEARLSILGGTQLSVIEAMNERPELWDRGLINRFWFCIAPNPTEDVFQDEEVSVPDEVLRPYREQLVQLGLYFRQNHPVAPYVLSAEADKLYTAWRNRFKRRHRIERGELHYITGFCRKLEEKVLRWATVIHAFTKHTEREVSEQAVKSALKVARYALSHFMHVYGLTHGSKTSSIERALRRHLAPKKGNEVTLRDIKRGLPSFARAPLEVQDEAIDNLAEDGFLKRKEVRRADGGRPSLRLVVL